MLYTIFKRILANWIKNRHLWPGQRNCFSNCAREEGGWTKWVNPLTQFYKLMINSDRKLWASCWYLFAIKNRVENSSNVADLAVYFANGFFEPWKKLSCLSVLMQFNRQFRTIVRIKKWLVKYLFIFYKLILVQNNRSKCYGFKYRQTA